MECKETATSVKYRKRGPIAVLMVFRIKGLRA
jgi:hypothetical protein